MDRTGLDHRRVESAQSPARRGRVPGFDLSVVDGLFDAGAINIKSVARHSDFCELDDRAPDAVALADSQRPPFETGRSQVFAERAVEQRKAEGNQLLDSF